MFGMGVFLHYMEIVKKAIAVLIRILGKGAIASIQLSLNKIIKPSC
ncbi:MAG: hypothetical protein RLZZ532_2093 [Cyanobacteriota bacterium]|jgi:hypothetical protein